MESLTTDSKGVKLSLSNFKKLYNYYDKDVFIGELSRLCKVNKCTRLIGDWRIFPEQYGYDRYSSNVPLSFRFINIYQFSISPGVHYSANFNINDYIQRIRDKLGFNNNVDLLTYLVEEFTLDLLYVINRITNPDLDHMTFKQYVNNMYFNHAFILPSTVYQDIDGQMLLIRVPL